MHEIARNINLAIAQGELTLPALPELALRIRDAVSADDVTILKVAKLIEFEPNIAARIVQLANSSVFSGQREVSSCEEAVTRLGLHVVRDIVTCMVMRQLYTAPVDRLKHLFTEIWEQSVHVAAISCVIAVITPRMNPEKALLAGLVHEIGALPLISYAESRPQLRNDEQLLRMMMSELKATLGKSILVSWNFEKELAEIPLQIDNWYREHKHDTDYADIVLVAKLHSAYGKKNSKLPALIDLPAFKKMKLSELGPDASLEVLHEAKSEILQVMKMLQ